jgi:hypothetical protein
MIIARADGRAPRATAASPAMTPAPPAPATVHDAKVTSGIDGRSENHHGGPAAGLGTWMTAELGPATSTAIMIAAAKTIRIAAIQARTRLSQSRAGRDPSLAAGAEAGEGTSAGREPSGVYRVVRSVRDHTLAPVAGTGRRGEPVPEAPGRAERDGSPPLPNLLATPACRIKIANDGVGVLLPRQACGTAPWPKTRVHPPKFTGPDREDGTRCGKTTTWYEPAAGSSARINPRHGSGALPPAPRGSHAARLAPSAVPNVASVYKMRGEMRIVSS